MKKPIVALTVLFLLAGFGSTAEAQTVTAPICQVGADPVDATWIPPLDWTMIKTEKPELVTQKSGSGKDITCVLRAGNIVAYPPDGGNPKVVVCGNEILKGRPEGLEIPRSLDPKTIRAAGEQIAIDLTVKFADELRIKIEDLELPPPPRRQPEPDDDDGYRYGTKSKIATVLVVAIIVGDKNDWWRHRGPNAKTKPAEDVKCTATGIPANCKTPGPPGTGSSIGSSSVGQAFVAGFNKQKGVYVSITIGAPGRNKNGRP